MGIRTDQIPLGALTRGHMLRHDGANKVVYDISTGYPQLGAPWSRVVTFADFTQVSIPWPTAQTTVNIITGFF